MKYLMQKWGKTASIIMCVLLLSGCGSPNTTETAKTSEKPQSDHTNLILEYAYYEDEDGDAAQFYTMVDWQMDDGSHVIYDVGNGTYQKEDGTVVAKQSIVRADENHPGWYMLEIYDEESTADIYSKWKFFSDFKEGKAKVNKILSSAQFRAKDEKKKNCEAVFDPDKLEQDEDGAWVWRIGTVDHGDCIAYGEGNDATAQEEEIIPRADQDNPISIDISWDEKQLKKPDQVSIPLNLSYSGECKEIKSEIVGLSEVYMTDDGTQLVSIQYDDPSEPFHHVVIHVLNEKVNMDIDWSSGKGNKYEMASCKVLTAYQGQLIDEKDETNALVEGENGEKKLGICSIRMGIYCPYDPTWDPSKEQ